jgi:hypothetical protein
LFLFIRFLPMISIFEMRTLLPGAHAGREGSVPEQGDGAPVTAAPPPAPVEGVQTAPEGRP